MSLKENPCAVCLTQHAPGAACPPAEPERSDEPRPPSQTVPDRLRAVDDIKAMLAEMGQRIALQPDEAPLDQLGPPPACPQCGDARVWRRVKNGDEEPSTVEAYCRPCVLCVDVPAGFRCRFDSVDIQKRVRRQGAIVEAREATTKRVVLIVGPAGTGKSSLLAAMYRQRAVAKRERNAFIMAKDIAVARQQHELGKGEPPLVRRALEAPILCLDDLGNDKPVPGSAISDVIFERHAQRRPYWVTTALTRKETHDRYGDGLVRRITEGAVIIDCTLSGDAGGWG